MTKIKKTQIRRNSNDSDFGSMFQMEFSEHRKSLKCLTHFVVIRPNSSIFVIWWILSIHGSNPTLNTQEKQRCSYQYLKMFQSLV